MAVGVASAGGKLRQSRKSITFDGTAGLGQVGNVPLFTVTGEVLMAILSPFCTGSLTEAGATATIALGVTGSTAIFIAATDAVDIDANEFWVDTTPDANAIAVPDELKDIFLTANIVGTVAVDDVNGGTLRIDVFWMALSADGNVAAA